MQSLSLTKLALLAFLLFIFEAQFAFAKGPVPPLIAAAQKGDFATVKSLLEQGSDPNIQDVNTYTPLIYACRGGHADIAELLIAKGAAVNYRSKAAPHHTALMSAVVGGGHESTVKLLLAKGADQNIKDSVEKTPLDRAREGQYEKIVLLLESAKKNTARPERP